MELKLFCLDEHTTQREGKGNKLKYRFVIIGQKANNNGYISRFPAESITVHPDFQTAIVWTIDALSSGTNDITTETGQIIGTETTESVSVESLASLGLTNLGLSYSAVSPYTSEVYFQVSAQSYAYT